jgi:hypothetical protein
MSRRFLVTLQGKGFSVPVKDSVSIIGFFTLRRVLADTPAEAERQAIDSLKEEDKFRELVDTRERELGFQNGWSVRVDSIGQLSWFRWYFSKYSPSLIYYLDDAPNQSLEPRPRRSGCNPRVPELM